MASIKLLKDKFDALVFSETNMVLYEALLRLDISDFKPVMESLLSGEIDIEDTRKIFANDIKTDWLGRYIPLSQKDARLSPDIAETLKSNLVARLSGNGDDIIKENLIYPDLSDLKRQIADTYAEEYGETLTPAEIEMLLPIVENELYVDMNIQNDNAVRDKADQRYISDSLSYKPNVEM